jgi:putative ABC transport system permease protein
MRGAGITVREAISTYGLSGGGGVIDWLMAKLAFIPRMTSMAFSNTFRNKTRVFMTQITLVGAGVLFMAVMSAQSSIVYTFGPVLLDTLRADIFFGLDKKERFEPVTRLTRQTEPASREIEMWASVRTKIRPAGQAEGFDDRLVTITGLPIPSAIYGHQLRGGRWLQPDDTYALVMHQKEAAKLDVGVGDWVTVDIPLKRESDWQVVGLLNDPLEPNRIVAPRDTILQEERKIGRGNNLFLTTTYIELQQNVQSAAKLRSTLYERGYDVSANDADTVKGLGEEAIKQMNIIVYLLLIMAVLIAVIGGIALSGVLSINVLERRVEIGILRAIGASNRSIGSLFITEGMLLGWLSWLIAVPISIPFSTVLITAIGSAIDFELGFEYSVTSVWIWLAVITVIGIAASWLPARGAIRVSVRESLSYE